jgi:hypothetical protein
VGISTLFLESASTKKGLVKVHFVLETLTDVSEDVRKEFSKPYLNITLSSWGENITLRKMV